MKTLTAPILAQEQVNIREYTLGWVKTAMNRWKDHPWGGGHDEALWTRTWQGLYMLTGDEPMYQFLDKFAHDFVNHTELEACKCFLTDEDKAKLSDEER